MCVFWSTETYPRITEYRTFSGELKDYPENWMPSLKYWKNFIWKARVVDPRHFGIDPDPHNWLTDPAIYYSFHQWPFQWSSVRRYFPSGFFMNQFPRATEYPIRTVSNFFENSRRYSQVRVHHRYQRHWWQICHRSQQHWRQKLPLVSTTPATNFATSFTSVVDTGTDGNLPPVSLTLVANNGNNIRLQMP